jgi:hypothetical protein
MCRGTGKTLDCFVELASKSLAATLISRVENLMLANKAPKMAQRIVTIEESSQGELMREVFPRAKRIIWDKDTGIPVMVGITHEEAEWSSPFRGFLTAEEGNGAVRFAESPQRVRDVHDLLK